MFKRKGGLLGRGQGAAAAAKRNTGDLLGPASAGGRSGQLRRPGQPSEDGAGSRFTLRQRLIASGDEAWIVDERGENAFLVNARLLRLRDVLLIEDTAGHQVYGIRARLVELRRTIEITRPDGGVAAIVHNAWFSPVRYRWTINVPGAANMLAQGNVLQHEYEIRQGGARVAVISKSRLRLRDTYQVDVQHGVDAALVLAVTIVIDLLSHHHAAGGAGGTAADGPDVREGGS